MAKKAGKNKGGLEDTKPAVVSPPVAASTTPKSKGAGKAKSPARAPSPPPPMEIDDDLPDSPSESSEADDSDVEDNANGAAGEWPKQDDLELFSKIRAACPKDDTMKYDSRVNHLDWEAIKFGSYSAEDCKNRWNFVQSHVRHYRVLSEVLTDAAEWTNMPWYNFNKGGKSTMKHPDLPKKPLTSYMLFYMEQKDNVAKTNPGLIMTELSKHIANLYNNLPEKKKQKYVQMAEDKKKEYNKEMDKFLKDHPDYVPPKSAGKFGGAAKPVAPRVPTPAKLYADHYMPKLMKEGMTGADARNHCSKAYRELSEVHKLKWINKALAAEVKYNEELEKFKQDYPDVEVPKKVNLLTKDEIQIRDKSQGKPEKPPNSGYSLFSREMLAGDALKNFDTKDRMMEISRMWKELDEDKKAQYNERALVDNANYKMEYAAYLSKLPEDQRKAELLGSTGKALKRLAAKASAGAAEKKAKTDESTGAEDDEEDDDFAATTPKKPAIQKPQNSLQSFLEMNLAKYQAKFPKMQDQELKRLMAKEFSKLTPEQKKKYDSVAQKSKNEAATKSPPAKSKAAPASPSKAAPAASKAAATKKATAAPAVSSPTTKSNGSATAKPSAKAGKQQAAAGIPDWAVKDWPLYPKEPPKPYENVKLFHAAITLKGRKPTTDEAETLWSKLSKKERKKVEEDHTKKSQQYSKDFEAFVRNKTPAELKKYQAAMKARQPQVDSDEEDEEDEDESDTTEDEDDEPKKGAANGDSSSSSEDEDDDDD